MNALTRITLGRLQVGGTGADRFIPVSGVDVAFPAHQTSAQMPATETSVSFVDNSVSVTLKSSVLASDMGEDELAALFSAPTTVTEVT